MKNITDFSRPQRMSKVSFFIILSKTLKRELSLIATIAVIGLFNLRTIDSSFWKYAFMGIGAWIILSLAISLLSYLSKKFYVKDENLVFINGIMVRETTSVPLDRIQSLRTSKGILYQLLGLRGIVFDTLATRQEEIELILSESDWSSLSALIEEEERREAASPSVPPEYNSASTSRFSSRDLLLSALCQNHLKGLLILGSSLLVIFRSLSDIPDDVTDKIVERLEGFVHNLTISPLDMIILLAGLYILMLVLWLVRVLLRYYDMSMIHDKRLLTFTYGMFTRASCRFFLDKVCTIWIKRNPLERCFGFATLILRQALNATAAKEEDRMKLYGKDSSGFFLSWWLGGEYANEPSLMEVRSGKGVAIRYVLVRLLFAVAVSAILLHYGLYVWLAAPALYLTLLIPAGILKMRNSRIELRSSYLIVHAGVLGRTESYLKYSSIETVRIRRTPLSGLTLRGTLHLANPGSSFSIASLPEADLTELHRRILKLCALGGFA